MSFCRGLTNRVTCFSDSFKNTLVHREGKVIEYIQESMGRCLNDASFAKLDDEARFSYCENDFDNELTRILSDDSSVLDGVATNSSMYWQVSISLFHV